jgi:hypothetical protein
MPFMIRSLLARRNALVIPPQDVVSERDREGARTRKRWRSARREMKVGERVALYPAGRQRLREVMTGHRVRGRRS